MWFYFALISAFGLSITTVISKKILNGSDEYAYALFSSLFTIPFLFLFIIIFFELPSFDKVFLQSISISVVLDIIALLLASRAVKYSEISLINPISAFNPVFTVIISNFALKEQVQLKGIVGIGFIVLGTYLLQVKKTQKGLLAPFKALIMHRGVRYFFAASFIWAITPVLQKTAILHTTPMVPPFASLVGLTSLTICYIFISAKFSKRPLAVAKKYFKPFIVYGLIGAIIQVGAFMAFSLTNLGYATAVFKLSMIFTVILGWLYFKEKDIGERLLGSIVMFIGVILLLT